MSDEARERWCRLLYWLGTLGMLDPRSQAEFDATYPDARVARETGWQALPAATDF